MRFLSRSSCPACPPPLAVPHWRRCLPWARADRRLAQVVDNVFGPDYARRMRDEVTLLAHDEAMHQNATHLVQGGKTELLVSPPPPPRSPRPPTPGPAPSPPPPPHVRDEESHHLCLDL